jgi:hypothetical protein
MGRRHAWRNLAIGPISVRALTTSHTLPCVDIWQYCSKIGALIEDLRRSRDGGIGTRGLLLPNHLHPDAGLGRMLPDVASSCRNVGST